MYCLKLTHIVTHCQRAALGATANDNQHTGYQIKQHGVFYGQKDEYTTDFPLTQNTQSHCEILGRHKSGHSYRISKITPLPTRCGEYYALQTA